MDKIPYIIVDNQRIPPLGRSPRPAATTRGEAGQDEAPFGIVDRVTLSREGREKSRLEQDVVESDFVSLDHPPKAAAPPLLTYSQKMLR